MADIIQIKFKVDGKEITATEKDLKELRRATKEAEGGAGILNKKIGLMSTAMAALGAVATAGALVKFAADTAAAVREIDNLAKVAGISTTKFQQQAAAARTVGIEQDKYADILKDVNDKIGDFLTTGAGPMADFFDTIGKQVGVTAEDFKNLSGDQALGLYVSTLEKAGASQQEMSFFMEALASDATMLVPLLRNNGEAMKELGENAKGVLSEDTIEKAKRLDDKFREMADTVKGQVTLAVVDATTALGEMFGLLEKPVKTEADKALERVLEQGARRVEAEERLAKARRKGDAEAIKAAETNLKYVDWAIEAAWEHKRAVDGVAAAEKAAADAKLEQQKKDDEAKQKARATNLKQQAEAEAQAARDKANAEALATQRANELEAFLKLADPMRAYNQQLADIESQMEEHKDNPEIVAQLAIAYEKVTEKSQESAKAQALANAEAKKLAELNFEKYLQSIGAVYDFALVHEEQLKNLQKALALNKITAEEYAAEILKLASGEEGEGSPFQQLLNDLTNFDAKMKEAAQQGILDMADGIAEMAVSGKANFKEMTASILKDISKMIIKMLILKAIEGALSGTRVGNYLGMANNAAGQLGANANGGIIMGGNASIVGERGPEVIMPAASTRVIPNHQMGMGGGNAVNVGSINVTVQDRPDETSEEQAQRIGKAIRNEMRGLVINELNNQSRQGNMLNPNPIKAFR